MSRRTTEGGILLILIFRCDPYETWMIDNSQKTLSPKAKRELTVIGPPQVEQMIEKEDAELVHA